MNAKDAERGFEFCVANNRGLHALLLQMAGARLPANMDADWPITSNHQLLQVLGENGTIPRLLADRAAAQRAQGLLAA